MGWYEAIKDGISAAQKADNIQLVKELIDVQKQMLDAENENINLKKEIEALKEQLSVSSKIKRNKETFITLIDASQDVLYCSACWDSRQSLIQVRAETNGKFHCPICSNNGYYDREGYNEKLARQIDEFNSVSNRRSRG